MNMDVEFHMVYYFHMRKSTFSERKRELDFAVGVTCQVDERHYFLCADVDNPRRIMHIINNLPRWVKARMCGYIIARTKKGNHLIILGRFTWSQCNKFWTTFKYVIDNGWIQLQRLRHKHMNGMGAVLRVCGKYREPDIDIVVADYEKCDESIKWWVQRYLKAVAICYRGGASNGRDKGKHR